MTDQTIPADKIREIIASYRGRRVWGGMILDALKDLLPAPTLADMTVEERRACTWMQADTESEGRTVILQPNASVGRALMLDQEANLAYAARNEVTPRPDLPRMTWPDTDQGADTSDAPPSILAVGSVWADRDALAQACRESGRDQITVTDRDDNVGMWDGRRDDWRSRWPIPKYAPFTIIHAGKKADQ